MSLFNRLGAALRGNPLENPATPLSAPAAWLYDLFGGTPTSAGVTVNETTAMQQATIFSIINGIQSDVSSLPLTVYEFTANGGKKPAVDADLYYLLAVEPNPDMTAAAFIGCITACVALTGNGYAEIQREGSKPVALWPRHPHFVRPLRAKGGEPLSPAGVAAAGDLLYEVKDTVPSRFVRSADMIHVKGLTVDGWVGISPIEAARQTIGKTIAAERFGAGFFGRGSRPSGLLTGPIDQKNDVKMQQARSSWEKANAGDNQGRTAVMPAGWTWTKIGVSPNEAQFIETEQMGRTQLCGLWRFPPHMAGDTSRLSNANHESQALEYVTFTLRPLLVRLEQEFERKLVPSKGRTAGKYTVRFDTSELIRGDYASVIEAVAMGKQWGIYTTNKALEKLGDNPIGPAGDVLYMPLNMIALGPDGLPIPDPDIAGTSAAGGGDGGDGGNGGGDDAKPKGNGGRNQRAAEELLLTRMQRAYGPLFRDAIGRLVKRDKRDSDAVQQVCGPVLETIAAEAIRQAVTVFRLEENHADLGHEKILRDYRGSLAKRAAEWKDELGEAEASAELARAVRAITIGIFREAGSLIATAA